MHAIQHELKEQPPGEDIFSLRAMHGMSDGLACFNHLYRVITNQILAKLNESNAFFQDPEFLNELDLQFARRYLHAIATSPSQDTPSSWRVLFQKRSDSRITPMQFAVAGVNTHVNFDLPFAVVKTVHALRRTKLDVPQQRHDYDRVNNVFFAKIPKLRHHLEESWEKRIDRDVLRLINNRVDDVIVVVDRALAWVQAERLWRTPVGEQLDRAERRIDDWVSVVNRGLLAPVPSWARDHAAVRSMAAQLSHTGAVVAGRVGSRFVPGPRAHAGGH
jgi:hypothetical protein